MIQLCKEIALEAISDGSDTERPTCQIMHNGEDTGRAIQGALLEACVKFDTAFLLFITDDIPYEEALYCYLLDSNFMTLDGASIGAPYSTGSFTDLVLQPPSTVDFRFIGDTQWSIELLSKPEWRIPFVGDPKGVMHKLSLKRHFKIKGNPLPESG